MEVNNKIPTFVVDFNNYLTAIKNISTVYIQNMTVTVQQFLEFINTHKFNNKYNCTKEMSLNDIREITNSDIYSFMFFLAENHYKMGSRITKTEHLRTFFDYLFRLKNLLFKEPIKKIKREKVSSRKLPNYLSIDESKKLLNLYLKSNKDSEIKYNAMIHLFLHCGLRVSELSNLNISDLNFNNNTFIIYGKGNKERTGYINEKTRIALLRYIEIRKKIQTKECDALFLSEKEKKRITTRGIRKIIKNSYTKIDITSEKYSVHTLRHTCATLLYRTGVDIKIIKELLGHVKIETTEIYTHLYNKKVMEAMYNHPLAKFKMKNAMEYELLAG